MLHSRYLGQVMGCWDAWGRYDTTQTFLPSLDVRSARSSASHDDASLRRYLTASEPLWLGFTNHCMINVFIMAL